MRDYWLTQDLLRAIGLAYLAVTVVALALAITLPKRRLGKAAAALTIVGIASVLPWRVVKENAQQRVVVDERAMHLAKAQALFAERCKTAGEKIHRTVEGVEGIFLIKIRPAEVNFSDQFKLDDPYGRDGGGDQYILNFLRGYYHQRTAPRAEGAPPRVGYRYAEAIDPLEGRLLRYTGTVREVVHTSSPLMGGDGKTKFSTKDFVLERVEASHSTSRYGVSYDDISTREDREHWIAGSSLKVIDLKTDELLAERVGYMIDVGQGSLAGATSPWLRAANYACPGFQRNPFRPLSTANGGGSSAQAGQTLDFVEKVLKPKL